MQKGMWHKALCLWGVYRLEGKDWQGNNYLKSSVCLCRSPWERGDPEKIWSHLWESFRECIIGAESKRRAIVYWEQGKGIQGSREQSDRGPGELYVGHPARMGPEFRRGLAEGGRLDRKLEPHVEVFTCGTEFYHVLYLMRSFQRILSGIIG